MPRVIYMDTDTNLGTWRHIAEAGNYAVYTGRANRGDVIIRWGCNHGRYQGHYPEGVRVLNKRIILGKIEQGELFKENGIQIPTIYKTRLSWERDGRPQLLIKPSVGQMGVGIRLVDRPNFNDNNKLYQKYIPKDKEYRAMMVDNLIAFLMRKLPGTDPIRWNQHRGAIWQRVPEDNELRHRIKELGRNTLRALDYDFGAIDLIEKEGHLYVLECNSRPELSEIDSGHFVRAIEIYLNRRERN